MTGDGRVAAKLRPSLVPVSRRRLALFRTYVHWYLGRHFHALRIAHAERCPLPDVTRQSAPIIFYVNHPSWWDPLTGLLVEQYLLPAREHYSPMDAEALAHYGIFRRLGMFPVEQGTPRGAVQFLRASLEVLTQRNGVLWITPQGTFTDVRTRPLSFRPGLAALARRVPEAILVPVAFEYTFWDERLPEILVNVGRPVPFSETKAHNLEDSLSATLDELERLSIARDAAAFQTILSGSAGIGGIYEVWQRLRASLTGRRYEAEHGSIRRQ